MVVCQNRSSSPIAITYVSGMLVSLKLQESRDEPQVFGLGRKRWLMDATQSASETHLKEMRR